jgi:hypothetical protein
MNKRFHSLNGALLAGTASFSTTLLAHPGTTQHPAVTGPMHGLMHFTAAASVLLAAGALVAAVIWLVARTRAARQATEQE